MPPLNKGRCPVTIVTGRWGRTLRLWRIVPHLWRIVPLFLTEKCGLVQPIYLR